MTDATEIRDRFLEVSTATLTEYLNTVWIAE